jgi:hypothetical protein
MNSARGRGIDPVERARRAAASEDGEADIVVERGAEFKLGNGVCCAACEKPAYFIEVVVCMCPEEGTPDLDRMLERIYFLKSLRIMGFALRCEDYGVSCEKLMPIERFRDDCEAVMALVRAHFKRREG